MDADTSSTDGWGAKLRLLIVATWSHNSSFKIPAQQLGTDNIMLFKKGIQYFDIFTVTVHLIFKYNLVKL